MRFSTSNPFRATWIRKSYSMDVLRRIMVVVLLILPYFLIAQGVTVTAKLDTNQIRIGEQFTVTLTSTASKGTSVSFPIIPDTLKGLEVIRRTGIDTLKSAEGKPLTLQQQLVMTGFDSGYYVIEPFHFLVKSSGDNVDTLPTEAQLIAIKTIQVDTTKAIKDIKPVMDPPFDWRELIPWLIGSLILIALAFAAWMIYRRYKNKPVIPVQKKKPDLPPHVIALEALDALEKEKLWQQGYFKEYQIRLTDILRAYIEHRYEVASQESTTDETLSALKALRIETTELQKLESILRLADLVKFAKAIPVMNENEQSMTAARQFVTATMNIETSTTDKEVSS